LATPLTPVLTFAHTPQGRVLADHPDSSNAREIRESLDAHRQAIEDQKRIREEIERAQQAQAP
jgi:hypothetical protein